MSLLGNIIWLIFGGLLSGLGYIFWREGDEGAAGRAQPCHFIYSPHQQQG